MAKLTPLKAHRPTHPANEKAPKEAGPNLHGLPAGEGNRAAADEHVDAYARVRAEIDALPRHEARRINVNVTAAAALALGALPKIMALRDAMREKLVAPPLEVLDKLRDYALAAAYAHALTLPRDEDQTRVRSLLNEGAPLRERLLLNAESLASFGLLDATRVASIRRGAGHYDTAQDLTTLSALFGEAWPTIASKTPVTEAEIRRAAQLGGLLLEALGQRLLRTDGSADPDAAEERLAKAYELFFRAYDECRRAVIYLRWHEGDADQIAPSLMQSRRRRRRRASPDEPNGSGPRSPEPATDEPDGETEGAEAEAELAPATPAMPKRRAPG